MLSRIDTVTTESNEELDVSFCRLFDEKIGLARHVLLLPTLSNFATASIARPSAKASCQLKSESPSAKTETAHTWRHVQARKVIIMRHPARLSLLLSAGTRLGFDLFRHRRVFTDRKAPIKSPCYALIAVCARIVDFEYARVSNGVHLTSQLSKCFYHADASSCRHTMYTL